jgi:hypothetical protein
MVLNVLLRLTDSDYPFSIFKLFLSRNGKYLFNLTYVRISCPSRAAGFTKNRGWTQVDRKGKQKSSIEGQTMQWPTGQITTQKTKDWGNDTHPIFHTFNCNTTCAKIMIDHRVSRHLTLVEQVHLSKSPWPRQNALERKRSFYHRQYIPVQGNYDRPT